MGIMKLTKQQKDLIEKVKISVQSSQAVYDALIKVLPLKNDIKNGGAIEGRLYDYVFNNYGSLNNIFKK